MSLAWADHGDGLRASTSPLIDALIWAGVAFAVGMVLVAVITLLARRRSTPK